MRESSLGTVCGIWSGLPWCGGWNRTMRASTPEQTKRLVRSVSQKTERETHVGIQDVHPFLPALNGDVYWMDHLLSSAIIAFYVGRSCAVLPPTVLLLWIAELNTWVVSDSRHPPPARKIVGSGCME